MRELEKIEQLLAKRNSHCKSSLPKIKMILSAVSLNFLNCSGATVFANRKNLSEGVGKAAQKYEYSFIKSSESVAAAG